jgi:hypothetical protein
LPGAGPEPQPSLNRRSLLGLSPASLSGDNDLPPSF